MLKMGWILKNIISVFLGKRGVGLYPNVCAMHGRGPVPKQAHLDLIAKLPFDGLLQLVLCTYDRKKSVLLLIGEALSVLV